MDDERIEEYADVFSTLADETRLDVLMSIRQHFIRDGGATFSEAMEAAGFEDSGHFSYHLEKLSENFLHKRGEEYWTTTATHVIAPVVAAGRLTDFDFEVDSPTLGVSCQRCGEPLSAHFEYDFYVACRNCHNWEFMFPLSPDVAENGDLRRLAVELDRTLRKRLSLLVSERCSACGGEPQVRFRVGDPSPLRPPLRDVWVDAFCRNCARGYFGRSVGRLFLAHPTVRQYARDHDIDLDGQPHYEYTWARTDDGTEIHSEDPLEIAQYAYVDGCRMLAIFEEDGGVRHVDHVPIDRGRLPERA